MGIPRGAYMKRQWGQTAPRMLNLSRKLKVMLVGQNNTDVLSESGNFVLIPDERLDVHL
jgi:hypothetical protein